MTRQALLIGILVMLVFIQLACGLPILQTGTGTPAGKVLTPTFVTIAVATDTPGSTETVQGNLTPAAGQIDLNLLKNFTYQVQDNQIQVVLKDGTFSSNQATTRFIEPAAFGDLNGDGKQDAAVVLATNTGGSGTYYDLIAVLDQNGTPAQAGIATIGDRQLIKDLQIANGRIILDYITQGLSDPSCCPNEHRLRSYLFEGGVLRLAGEQVLTGPDVQATPLPVEILIDQPSLYEVLTNPLIVRGRVSQVPAERKLAYYVTDLQATLLAEGEVTLEGEPGGPGAFAFEVTLGELPPGLIQVEVVDAANGLLRGRSVVVLRTP